MLSLWHTHSSHLAVCRAPQRRQHPTDQPTFGITVIQVLTESHGDALCVTEAGLVFHLSSPTLLLLTASPCLSGPSETQGHHMMLTLNLHVSFVSHVTCS